MNISRVLYHYFERRRNPLSVGLNLNVPNNLVGNGLLYRNYALALIAGDDLSDWHLSSSAPTSRKWSEWLL